MKTLLQQKETAKQEFEKRKITDNLTNFDYYWIGWLEASYTTAVERINELENPLNPLNSIYKSVKINQK